MARKDDCQHCRETYSVYVYDPHPPCGPENERDEKKCPWNTVELLPESIPVWNVWARVADQHIMGIDGPKALNQIPVYEAMDRMRIPRKDQLYCLDLIRKVYREVRKAKQ